MEYIKRWEMVEVIVGANNSATTQKIPEQQNLRMDTTQDIIIVGLEMWSIETMPFSPITSSNPLATTAQMQNTFLTLYINEEESIHLMPAIKLIAQRVPLATSTAQFGSGPVPFKNLQVNWDKSYFQVAQPYNTGGANAAFSLILGVSYLKLKPGTWAKLTSGQVQGL
jgi:hypothetical protein